jgi:hypothetical protein
MKVVHLVFTLALLLVAAGATAGPLPGGADSDGDTVEDAFDNCADIANASQTDTDHNGCGDACSANISCDANGDTSVGAQDFTILRMQFGNTPPANISADCNGDTSVGSQDFSILRMQFGNTVGPSGITTAQCDPSGCRCTPQ